MRGGKEDVKLELVFKERISSSSKSRFILNNQPIRVSYQCFLSMFNMFNKSNALSYF